MHKLQKLLNHYLWEQGKNCLRIHTDSKTIEGIDVRRASAEHIVLTDNTVIQYADISTVYEVYHGKNYLIYTKIATHV